MRGLRIYDNFDNNNGNNDNNNDNEKKNIKIEKYLEGMRGSWGRGRKPRGLREDTCEPNLQRWVVSSW